MPLSKNAEMRIRYLDGLIAGIKSYTSKELLDKLEDHMESEDHAPIQRRQFYKDIDYMKELASRDQVDLDYSRSKGRYIYSKEGYSIYGVPIGEQDIEILTQALAVLKGIHGLKNTRELELIIERLAEKIGRSVEQLEDVIVFDEVPGLKGIDHLNSLLTKIVEKQPIVLHYKPYQREEFSYLFHPYFLKEYNNRWYIFGWNPEEEKIYNAPLDRIASFEDSYIPYDEENRISPTDYFRDIVGVTKNEGEPVKIRLKFNFPRGHYVLTKPIHTSQGKPLKETEDFVIIQIRVIPNRELESIIASFGDDVEILSDS